MGEIALPASLSEGGLSECVGVASVPVTVPSGSAPSAWRPQPYPPGLGDPHHLHARTSPAEPSVSQRNPASSPMGL